MAKYLMLVFSLVLMFMTQAKAQKIGSTPNEIVDPKLIVVHPGGGGYNLEQRVFELERSNQALSQAVRDSYERDREFDRRLRQLEKGNYGGGYGNSVRCEATLRTGARLIETGYSEQDAKNKLQEGCVREFGPAMCQRLSIRCSY